VECAAIGSAFHAVRRSGKCCERITRDASSLEVRSLPGHRRTCFPSYWVRVQLSEGDGRPRLLLSSHGRKLEVGAFLSEQERIDLSRKIMVLLAEFAGSRVNRL
jgi:uncharacterized membrane protein